MRQSNQKSSVPTEAATSSRTNHAVNPLAIAVVTPPIAVNLNDAARLTGMPSWTIREAILSGALHAKRAGRTHIIQIDELKRWVAALKDVPVSTAPSIVARHAHREGA